MLDGPIKSFHHKNEKKWREWVSLSEASGRTKDLRGRAIHQNWKAGRGHQSHDPSDPIVVERKSNENLFDVDPINFVIGFGYIQLHDLPHMLFTGKRVDHLMGLNNVI